MGTALFAAFVFIASLGVLLSDRFDPLALAQWKDQKPEILEANSRSIVETLIGDDVGGNEENEVESSFGFERRNLGEASKPELLFWYRQGDSPLVPHPPNLMALPFMWGVTSSNPPLAAGMVSIKLASNGALVEFVRVEHQRVGGQPSGTSKMPSENENDTLAREAFQLAKLKLNDFETLEDSSSIPWPPPVFADTVSIWQKKHVPAEDSTFVIAGSRAGRLVYFRQFQVTESEQVRSHQITTSGRFDSRGNLFLLVLVAFSVPLALLNLRVGRGDTKGALKLALCFFTIEVFLWLPALHHTADLGSELRQATDYLIYCIAFSFRLWLYYIALEPYVRRLWPSALIASSRILSGKVRDPLVGRELLIGSVVGAAFGVATFASGWTTYRSFTYPLLGGRHALTAVLAGFQEAVMGVVAILVFLLIFRVCLRRTWLVFLAFALAHMLLFTALDANPAVWAVNALLGAAYALLIVRFGLVACISCHLSMVAFSLPFSTHVTEWYTESGLLYLGALLIIALFGYYTSTLAGRDWSWDPITTDAL